MPGAMDDDSHNNGQALAYGMRLLQYNEKELVGDVRPMMLSFRPDMSRTLAMKTGTSKWSREVALKDDSSHQISLQLSGGQLQKGSTRTSTPSIRLSVTPPSVESPSREVAITVTPAPAPFHRTSIVSFLPR